VPYFSEMIETQTLSVRRRDERYQAGAALSDYRLPERLSMITASYHIEVLAKKGDVLATGWQRFLDVDLREWMALPGAA
jgi:hypothetical protein